ncbi:hypothetical protein GCM10010520_40900 [Rhizobium viscosum]
MIMRIMITITTTMITKAMITITLATITIMMRVIIPVTRISTAPRKSKAFMAMIMDR